MVVAGLSQGDNNLISFVVSCLYSAAITKEELRMWALHMIDKYEVDELPLYMFDLMDFDDPACHVAKIIGFATGWHFSHAESLALDGITTARGFEVYEKLAPLPVLLKKIRERPWLFKRFKETFPFIDMSEAEKKIYGEFRGQYTDF